MDEWLENGCRLGWLIDTEAKKIYIYRPGMQLTIVRFNDKVTGEDILPGFELDLSFIEELE
jgi:Uma2 family endonuclease